jgi:hypothetical protein
MIVCNDKLYEMGVKTFISTYYYFKEISNLPRKEREKYLTKIYNDFGRKKSTVQKDESVSIVRKVRIRK